MQLSEYDALEKVEREHWFYKGKRILTILDRPRNNAFAR